MVSERDPRLTRDPAPLPFAQAGKGPDVILVHGAMTCLDEMAIALFPALRDAFRVTAFDRPGHGLDRAASTGGTSWAQAAAVHRPARALGIERPVVVGHSFGGAVALAYGMRYPHACAGVVALAPIVFPEPRPEHLIFAPRSFWGPLGLWSRALADVTDPVLLPMLWRAMFLPQAMPGRVAATFPFARAGRRSQRTAEGHDAAWLIPGLAASALAYRRAEVPLHVFTGDRDLVVNPAVHAYGLARAWPGARLSILHGLGHMAHHFAQSPIRDAIQVLRARP